MKVYENELYFRIKNSVHKNVRPQEEGGLGLKNLKKRLELIYGSDFSLITAENENSFETNIKLPLHGN
jgi:LytS/YehU family sensor histidine kinase